MKPAKYTIQCSCVICKKTITTAGLKQHIERHIKETQEKICGVCSSLHHKPGKFCSRACASGSHKPSIETKNKISSTLKAREKSKKKNRTYSLICASCNNSFIANYKKKKTCSPECTKNRLIESGKKSAANNVKRSKDEINLYELCSNFYNKVSHNETIFNGWDADILIHDKKLAILWNGPWHYKEMGLSNHSLKQVKTRDSIKVKEIINSGWTPIIFEDRYYTPKQAFDELINLYGL